MISLIIPTNKTNSNYTKNLVDNIRKKYKNQNLKFRYFLKAKKPTKKRPLKLLPNFWAKFFFKF